MNNKKSDRPTSNQAINAIESDSYINFRETDVYADMADVRKQIKKQHNNSDLVKDKKGTSLNRTQKLIDKMVDSESTDLIKHLQTDFDSKLFGWYLARSSSDMIKKFDSLASSIGADASVYAIKYMVKFDHYNSFETIIELYSPPIYAGDNDAVIHTKLARYTQGENDLPEKVYQLLSSLPLAGPYYYSSSPINWFCSDDGVQYLKKAFSNPATTNEAKQGIMQTMMRAKAVLPADLIETYIDPALNKGNIKDFSQEVILSDIDNFDKVWKKIEPVFDHIDISPDIVLEQALNNINDAYTLTNIQRLISKHNIKPINLTTQEVYGLICKTNNHQDETPLLLDVAKENFGFSTDKVINGIRQAIKHDNQYALRWFRNNGASSQVAAEIV